MESWLLKNGILILWFIVIPTQLGRMSSPPNPLNNQGFLTKTHPQSHSSSLHHGSTQWLSWKQAICNSIHPTVLNHSPLPFPHTTPQKNLQPTSTCTHHLNWAISMFPIPLANFPTPPPPISHGPWMHYFFSGQKFRQSRSASYNGNFLAWQVLRSSDKICRGLRRAFLVGRFFFFGTDAVVILLPTQVMHFKENSSNLL